MIVNTCLFNGNEILIEAPGDSNSNIIKSNLIWDINSFLSNQFDLYVYYLCRTVPTRNSYRLLSKFPKKYIAFHKLDNIFIQPQTISDKELNYYRKIADPLRKIDDDVFKEALLVENADIEYVAVERLEQLMSLELSGKRKKINQQIISFVPVYISLFGAKEIHMVINREDLLKSVQDICVRHCINKENAIF